jgi:hypothetical protein
MANILKITATIDAVMDSGVKLNNRQSLNVELASDTVKHFVQEISSSSNSAIEMTEAEIGTPGYIMLKNLDDTNYIQVGLSNQWVVKLFPGQFALFPVAADLYAKADTAACDLEFIVFEI